MPFYHVINGESFVGEKESSWVEHWAPLSFVTPLEMGRRQHGLFGKRQLEIEAMSHDRAIVRVLWGEVALNLKEHDKNTELQEVIDVGKTPLAIDSRSDEIRKVILKKGSELPIFRTSLMLEGVEEKLDWTWNMEEPSGLF